MIEENFLNSWRLREDVEGKEKENKQGSQKEEGKEGERERVEISTRRIFLDRLSTLDVRGKVFEALCPDAEVETVGDSLDFTVEEMEVEDVPWIALERAELRRQEDSILGIRVEICLRSEGGLHGLHSGVNDQSFPRRHQERRRHWKLTTHGSSRSLMLSVYAWT